MNFTNWQQQAIDSTDPLTIVIAGPGAGKSSTLDGRIKKLIQNEISPLEIVAITFTNEAARNMEVKLGTVRLGFVGTLHAFMLRLMQQAGKKFTVIDETQVSEIIGQLIIDHRWKGSDKAVKEAIAAGPFASSQGTALDLIRLDYYQRLTKGQLMDFDSILFFGLKLIKTLKLTYKHLLWDEFQDSSPIDAHIFHELQIPNKFIVGDVDQSLYKFRGGDPEIMLDLLSGKPGFKVCLQENFRCDYEICAAANRLITKNQKRFAKQTTSVSAQAGDISVHAYDSPVLEMNAIAASISACQGSVAVLTRTNALAGELASFLEAVGIPVQRKTIRQFPAGWSRCRLFLTLLTNPDNNELAYTFLKHSAGEKRANEAKLKALAAFSTINKIWLNLPANIPLADITEALAGAQIDRDSVDFVSAALTKLPARATLNELLIALAQPETRERDQGTGVVVCTVHAAKGREWDHVYLPAFEQGTFPSSRADIEEDRRVAFVAVTRARHRLVISWCRRRPKKWGGDDQNQPSQFITELAPKLYE